MGNACNQPTQREIETRCSNAQLRCDGFTLFLSTIAADPKTAIGAFVSDCEHTRRGNPLREPMPEFARAAAKRPDDSVVESPPVTRRRSGLFIKSFGFIGLLVSVGLVASGAIGL